MDVLMTSGPARAAQTARIHAILFRDATVTDAGLSYPQHRSQPRQTYLYRYYDVDGVLLYVGITVSLSERDNQHRQSSAWYALAARRTSEPYPNRWDAQEAERTAIKREKPAHNIVHNGVRS